MESFAGKLAVVTGAGSGIGLGIARRCARENMNLVLADIEQQALDQAQQELEALGSGSVKVQQLDVSDAAQVEALATEVFKQYGAVHLLVNNAGVGGGGRNCWELDLEYWQWILGVNLWGVIHGIKYFTPAMLEQSEGHIVNTASVAGLMSAPGSAAYNVSKHGVVTLSETLHGELRNANAALGVSVLCPSYVDTRIYAAERNRPGGIAPSEEQQAMEAAAGEFFAAVAMSTEQVADKVFEAIVDQRFYVLTHPGIKQQVDKRAQAIIHDGAPESTGAEDFPLA